MSLANKVPTSHSSLIAFNQVNVKINNSCLLHNINLEIEAGCWMGIVGPNGGGKSTLMKALLGLVPHQGYINLTWPGDELGKIGYVPQLAPFDHTLPITVLDYLRMVAEDRPIWWRHKFNKKINDMMVSFDISCFANKRIGTLSTGERQRVLICGALLNDPQVLMLDEPLAGVDKKGQTLLLDIFQNFHNQGKTIIMVEHHWQVIENYCQRVALIDGTVTKSGSVEEVFALLQQNETSLPLSKVK